MSDTNNNDEEFEGTTPAEDVIGWIKSILSEEHFSRLDKREKEMVLSTVLKCTYGGVAGGHKESVFVRKAKKNHSPSEEQLFKLMVNVSDIWSSKKYDNAKVCLLDALQFHLPGNSTVTGTTLFRALVEDMIKACPEHGFSISHYRLYGTVTSGLIAFISESELVWTNPVRKTPPTNKTYLQHNVVLLRISNKVVTEFFTFPNMLEGRELTTALMTP